MFSPFWSYDGCRNNCQSGAIMIALGKRARKVSPKAFGEDSPVVRKKYDSEDSKRRLVKAAINVFSKLGYDASTTKNIAKSAGVNESLIHRYFENKLGLFFAMMHDYHDCLTNTLPYPPQATVEEELSQFIRFRMEFSRRQKKFVRILITRAILDPKVRVEIKSLFRNGVPGLVERLEVLRSQGKISAEVAIEDLSLLVTALSFSMSMFTQIMSTLDEDVADRTIALGAKALAKGLAP